MSTYSKYIDIRTQAGRDALRKIHAAGPQGEWYPDGWCGMGEDLSDPTEWFLRVTRDQSDEDFPGGCTKPAFFTHEAAQQICASVNALIPLLDALDAQTSDQDLDDKAARADSLTHSAPLLGGLIGLVENGHGNREAAVKAVMETFTPVCEDVKDLAAELKRTRAEFGKGADDLRVWVLRFCDVAGVKDAWSDPQRNEAFARIHDAFRDAAQCRKVLDGVRGDAESAARVLQRLGDERDEARKQVAALVNLITSYEPRTDIYATDLRTEARQIAGLSEDE